ncbi:MAG: PTPA-CTERM sorting domain-containing protein [Cyanobacteria bacterium REEB459]|nr:PTPA-CTERM sorting domain-containing protein [Cyanobacteria bacterium REEB459]
MVATPAHAATIGVSSPAVVPTPALLPGLIGMGIAALRQRQAEQRKP